MLKCFAGGTKTGTPRASESTQGAQLPETTSGTQVVTYKPQFTNSFSARLSFKSHKPAPDFKAAE